MDKGARSTWRFVLEGLVPYTQANLKLAFKPSLFFAELETISRKNNQTIKNAYYRLIKNGFIEYDDDGQPRLTEKGRRKITPYKPEKLQGAELFVIFDVPESQSAKRRHLRLLLKELKFRQIQKSVWSSKYDSRQYLKAEIAEYGLQPYVLVYEARQI